MLLLSEVVRAVSPAQTNLIPVGLSLVVGFDFSRSLSNVSAKERST